MHQVNNWNVFAHQTTLQSLEIGGIFSFNFFFFYDNLNMCARMGTVFWNMTHLEKLPPTGLHANLLNQEIPFLDAFMINMGLCMSPQAMFAKFLIAIAFSEKIGDNPPRTDWYEEKWLKVSVANPKKQVFKHNLFFLKV